MNSIVELGSLNSLANVPVGPAAHASFSDASIERLLEELARIAAITELVCKLKTAEDQSSACQILVDRTREYLGAERVFVGLCQPDSPVCRLQAISQLTTFNPRDEKFLAAQIVLQEVLARGEAASWPVSSKMDPGGLLAHRQFAQANGSGAVTSGILRDASGQIHGAWMVIGKAEVILAPTIMAFLRAAEMPIASTLQLLARAQVGRIKQACLKLREIIQQQRGQMIIAGAIVIALALCIPFTYHPSCDCTVKPVTRRYVAAPFDGPLEKALVQPGDEVQAGELLARMDGREVRWELSGARVDLHRAGKERAGYLATHDSGKAEVARYEVNRLEVRIELLEHSYQNREILSPIEGVVVSGDLEDAEGMPLEVGQTLFEIAPLDAMIVELAVAEDDFMHVRPGMSVVVRLDAFPLRRFTATVTRIHPRAELKEDQNVFLAEVRLENLDGSLRPRMRGAAEIESDRHMLGWILFRRPITALVSWLGW